MTVELSLKKIVNLYNVKKSAFPDFPLSDNWGAIVFGDLQDSYSDNLMPIEFFNIFQSTVKAIDLTLDCYIVEEFFFDKESYKLNFVKTELIWDKINNSYQLFEKPSPINYFIFNDKVNWFIYRDGMEGEDIMIAGNKEFMTKLIFNLGGKNVVLNDLVNYKECCSNEKYKVWLDKIIYRLENL